MRFTYDWFTGAGCHKTWPEYINKFRGKPITVLEIGCFEGQATVWLLENILNHPDSRIICVDTFEGSAEHKVLGIDWSKIEGQFHENVKLWKDKVSVHKGKSIDVLRQLSRSIFDIAYIDGSHAAPDVITDACLTWPLLRPNSVLIFDDFEWIGGTGPLDRPKLAIESFLSVFADQLTVLHKGYQVILRKL